MNYINIIAFFLLSIPSCNYGMELPGDDFLSTGILDLPLCLLQSNSVSLTGSNDNGFIQSPSQASVHDDRPIGKKFICGNQNCSQSNVPYHKVGDFAQHCLEYHDKGTSNGLGLKKYRCCDKFYTEKYLKAHARACHARHYCNFLECDGKPLRTRSAYRRHLEKAHPLRSGPLFCRVVRGCVFRGDRYAMSKHVTEKHLHMK